VWAWLAERKGSLDGAIKAAGVRTDLTETEVREIIRRHLESHGISVT